MTRLENEDRHPEQFVTDGLSPTEDEQLASLLSKWRGGRISTPVFTELARMIPQPIVEVVVLRLNSGILETLLIPRPENDIVWPGKYHSPGSAIRASDYDREDQNPLNGPFERIQHNELKSTFAYPPVFACHLFRKGQRGPEVTEAYFTELAVGSDQPHHVWHPVDRLESNELFIQDQREHVLLAAEQYMANLKT